MTGHGLDVFLTFAVLLDLMVNGLRNARLLRRISELESEIRQSHVA